MDGRQACRTCIEVAFGVAVIRGLRHAIDELHCRAVSVQFRPPGRYLASSKEHWNPAFVSSYAHASPAMPPPRMMTFTPFPACLGNSTVEPPAGASASS